MGTVWHARHPEGVDVAVKVLRPEFASQPEQAEAFRKEVRSVAFLDHPGIVRVYDFGVVPEAVADSSGDRLPAKSLWLSMEYAEAGTLADLPPVQSWSELYKILLQILRALAHAHARGIVHRDLKPRNVLVHPVGRDPRADAALEPDVVGGHRVILTDYGIAHALHREGPDRAQAGTPGYMAPEQIRGDWRDLGSWTDLYSLGSLGWRLATGRSPFPGERAPAVLFAQLNARMRPFEPTIEVPAGFEPWLDRLLKVEAVQRYPCAADALADLETVNLGEPLPERRAVVPQDWRPFRPPPLSRPKGTGLALFVYRPWPLVGRTEVQDELWATFRTVAHTSRAQVVVLSGPPGVGKTRLATWLTERAEELGAAWTLRPPPARANRSTGRQTSGAYARPGSALPSAVRRLLRLDELPAEDVRLRLSHAFAERGSRDPQQEAAEVQALLDQSFQLGQVVSRTLDPHDESHQAWFALFDRLASDRPLIIFVENLHVEPHAVSLLASLLGTRRPVLAIATLDRTAQAPHAGPIRRLCDRARTIEVAALDAAGHREMVDTGVGLCDRLAQQVVDRTRGDLSLTVRMVTHWVRRGQLVPTSTGFDLKEGTDPKLSDALCDELASRLDGLGAPRTEALQYLAALAPRRVRLDEWSEVCASSGRPLRPETVPALIERGMLEAEEAADGPRYTLVPQAMREAILHRAEQAHALQKIHALCAGVLASKPKASAHERAVLHFNAAGLPDIALHHLRELIHRTLREAQWRRVPGLLQYERQLLQQLGVPSTDPRWFRNEVDELVANGHLGGTPDVQATRAILSRTAASGDPHTSARLARIILRAEAHAGRLRPDDLLLVQARRWAVAAEDISAQVELVRLGGEAAWRRMDVPLADRLLSEAADLAEANDDRVELLALLGEVRGLTGSTEQGSVLAARALELAIRNGSRAGLARALIVQATLSRHRGDAAGARDLAQRAALELDNLGVDGRMAEIQLGLALLGAGQTDEARTVLAARTDEDVERHVVAAAGLLGCAATSHDERQFDKALADWRAVADADRGYHPDTVWPLIAGARRALEAGWIDRAQILLHQASKRYQHLGDPASADKIERERRLLSASSPGR